MKQCKKFVTSYIILLALSMLTLKTPILESLVGLGLILLAIWGIILLIKTD